MIALFVAAYCLIFVLISLYSQRFVNNYADYSMAGSQLGLHLVVAMIVLNWLDANNVLGAPARFVQEGLGATVEDPFGATACLLLVAFLLGRKLYQAHVVSIGEIYKNSFGAFVEKLVTLIMVASYIGWLSGQFLAIGLIIHILIPMIPIKAGAVCAACLVMSYIVLGGMWAMAINNIIQMIILMVSLSCVFFSFGHQVGGFHIVWTHMAHDPRFHLPSTDLSHIMRYCASFLTMMCGLLPQQDLLQNVCVAKNEKTMQWGFFIAAIVFLVFSIIPLLLAYMGTLMTSATMTKDVQMFLPTVVIGNTNVVIQTIFFGAVFSALLGSTPYGLLAPAVNLAKNLVEPIFKTVSDELSLLITRVLVVVVGCAALLVLLCSSSSIYEAMTEAYKITLVAGAVPLIAALYWKKANRTGALCAIFLGICTWLACSIYSPNATIPPDLAGLLLSGFGMIGGTWVEQIYKQLSPAEATTQ